MLSLKLKLILKNEKDLESPSTEEIPSDKNADFLTADFGCDKKTWGVGIQ
jgi:hypothetical protein